MALIYYGLVAMTFTVRQEGPARKDWLKRRAPGEGQVGDAQEQGKVEEWVLIMPGCLAHPMFLLTFAVKFLPIPLYPKLLKYKYPVFINFGV